MKESKADFLRRWGLPYPHYSWSNLRYKHPPEKGVYWYHFSVFVRIRDIELWGTCISCGRPITGLDTCQAGHFMPAKDCGRDLLFDPLNVNAECAHCNAFDETHLLKYAENLDLRYGSGTALSLRNRREEYKNGPVVKDWSRIEYERKIQEIRQSTMEYLTPV